MLHFYCSFSNDIMAVKGLKVRILIFEMKVLGSWDRTVSLCCCCVCKVICDQFWRTCGRWARLMQGLAVSAAEEEQCFTPVTNGVLYRGEKNYTRGMKPCLPWSRTTQCRYHTFNSKWAAHLPFLHILCRFHRVVIVTLFSCFRPQTKRRNYCEAVVPVL